MCHPSSFIVRFHPNFNEYLTTPNIELRWKLAQITHPSPSVDVFFSVCVFIVASRRIGFSFRDIVMAFPLATRRCFIVACGNDRQSAIIDRNGGGILSAALRACFIWHCVCTRGLHSNHVDLSNLRD